MLRVGDPELVATPGRSRPPLTVMVIAGVAVLFFALPLMGLVGRVDWSNVGSELTSRQSLTALRLSVICSVAAALLSVGLGTPLAWVLARSDFPGKSLVRGIVLLPLVLPPVVGGVALLSAFSRRGILGRWLYDWFGLQLTFSTAGSILAATFVAMPFFVLTAEAGFRAIGDDVEDAAASLGSEPLEVARRVTLPLAAPAVIAGTILAWARALGEFGATITFAGNIEGRTQTLPLAIYMQIDTNVEAALAMSLVLLGISMAVIAGMREHWLRGLR